MAKIQVLVSEDEKNQLEKVKEKKGLTYRKMLTRYILSEDVKK